MRVVANYLVISHLATEEYSDMPVRARVNERRRNVFSTVVDKIFPEIKISTMGWLYPFLPFPVYVVVVIRKVVFSISRSVTHFLRFQIIKSGSALRPTSSWPVQMFSGKHTISLIAATIGR